MMAVVDASVVSGGGLFPLEPLKFSAIWFLLNGDDIASCKYFESGFVMPAGWPGRMRGVLPFF